MKGTVYERNYRAIKELVESNFEGTLTDFQVGHNHMKLRTPHDGFMPLSIEHLGNGRVAMAHYYEQNGDLIADPDMEIQLLYNMAEVISYQDSFGYKRVYPEPGKVCLALKKDLNQFLEKWLRNIRNQGHKALREQVAA